MLNRKLLLAKIDRFLAEVEASPQVLTIPEVRQTHQIIVQLYGRLHVPEAVECWRQAAVHKNCARRTWVKTFGKPPEECAPEKGGSSDV